MPVAWGVVGGVLAAGIALAAGLRVVAGYPPGPPGARRLTRCELALLRAAANATYPEGGALPPSGEQAGIPLYTDRYVAAVPQRTATLMRALFFLVEHATLLWPAPGHRGRRRFSSLSADQQRAVLEAWRTSAWFPRRLIFTSLRAILTMGYFADPTVLRLLGFAPKEIRSPRVEADRLYPPVGRGKEALPPPGTAPELPTEGPLAPDAPLHPAYREPA